MDSTRRFSDRVESYRKFRPGYPTEIIPFLANEVGLNKSSVVADIGSGTGIFTELLLNHGSTVYAVEPNEPMRLAAESALGDFPRFHSVPGTAEDPLLPPASVDIITSAQAFHWFDVSKARAAFERILKPGGWIVLIWNNRRPSGSRFLVGYEELLLTHGIGYPVVADELMPETIRNFFAPHSFRQEEFFNAQILDFNGMVGRLMSASYVPNSGAAKQRVLNAAAKLFGEENENGTVTIEYTTNVYYGSLTVDR